MIFLKLFLGFALLIIIYFYSLSYITRHDAIKAEQDRILAPCPNTPNCVLSTSTINEKAIEAFALQKDKDQAWAALLSAVKQQGGNVIIDDGQYMHAVFTSTLFRFKDDFEAQLNAQKIEVRSASRAGKSDLGQNRKRIEKIRNNYLEIIQH